MMQASVQIAVFGEPVDERALEQIKNVARDERVVSAALMADHHLGYSMPIGGVAVYEESVSPSGVGFDIGCGNKCVRTNLWVREIDENLPALLREIQRTVAFGLGRSNPTPVEQHPLFDRTIWTELESFSHGLRAKARAQLGTVGSGNHYVDLLMDDDGRLWVANHFGSRGLGHTICTGFLNLAKGEPFDARLREEETPTVLDLRLGIGQSYFEAMELAGEYAYAGRDYVIEQVLSMLGATSDFEVHNHHNFAWRENDGIVVRKGATPLTTEPAFIGGSMGDVSMIVLGTGEDIGALASAPHGAGRVMSRTKAAGKWKREKVTRTAPDGSTYTKKIRVRDKATAAVDWDLERGKLLEHGTIVLGAGADESPPVYKDLRAVLAHHPNIEVLRTLEPIGVVMAGEDVRDPYKD